MPGEHEHITRLERSSKLYFARKIQEFTVPVVLRGTPFQVAAWQRLQRIPYGETISYEQQARRLDGSVHSGRSEERTATTKSRSLFRVTVL